jgi:hypothetical protein
MPPDPAFINRWAAAQARERAHYQQFFVELCDYLDVPRPDPGASNSDDYCFERPVPIAHQDGHESACRIDLYKAGCFVIEAKQGSGIVEGSPATAPIGTARRGTPAWAKAMRKAFAQAARYAKYLPGRSVPVVITCDIGHVFEVWTDFSETGTYGGYGARRTIPFADLEKPEVQAFLRAVFMDPSAVDPARHAARVTREVAAHLADLARSLEDDHHHPQAVARFLMACLFTMFAEDTGLLPPNLFTEALERNWVDRPERFPQGLALLWNAMDKGLPFGVEPKILRFNGGLFNSPTILALTGDQLRTLLAAAKCDWSAVEPAIFGTLLERALNPAERAALGAHFTPRAYIERLVRPTVIEPLRAEWELLLAEVRLAQDAAIETADQRARKEHQERARDLLLRFHHSLCRLRILDPACGTGNFLYVSFAMLKALEEEVQRELADLGVLLLELRGVTVNPSQFLGIERNPRAREIADLVLWIGYLQWYRRSRPGMTFEEPVLRTYGNIENRDAVLTWSRERLKVDEQGKPVVVWNMRTTCPHPITGELVPDTVHGMVEVYEYDDPGRAEWPDADFIVGNPPFVGNKIMRQALGDGYTEALRSAWPDVTQTADLVMYWWDKAAEKVRAGRCRRFGLITTNSITQVFNRKVLERHLGAAEHPLVVAWAIPDHPWVDAGADVRIAMTVGTRADSLGCRAVLGQSTFESPERGDEGAAREVVVQYVQVDRIHADLSAGADVAGAARLNANMGMSFQGMNLVGKGFRLTPKEVTALGYDLAALPPVIRPYKNARDLTQGGPPRYVIDLFGLTEDEARDRYPPLYMWLLERVKPGRDQNKRESRRRNWWIFGEPVGRLRRAWEGLSRYIVTPETARHRFFTFATMELCPDHSLYAVCLDDGVTLGVLSSRFQTAWSLATGGWMGVGNDPRWRNSKCFDPFPFPDTTPVPRERISSLAERLDAHRKTVEGAWPKATLTAQYNALARHREALGGGPALDKAERSFHDRALTGVLASLHDDLDTAVAEAYGWPADLADEEILVRLVALNRERAVEEVQGRVRWLRPAFQAPTVSTPVATQLGLEGMEGAAEEVKPAAAKGLPPWPNAVGAQLKAVRDLVLSNPLPSSAEDVARCFKGARRAAVKSQLAALEELGILASFEAVDGYTRWSRAP